MKIYISKGKYTKSTRRIDLGGWEEGFGIPGQMENQERICLVFEDVDMKLFIN